MNEIDSLLSQLKSLKTPYAVLYPLKRIKGKLNKVHRLKLNSYPRFLYINPQDGALISYPNANKFPLSPNYIIKLNEIVGVNLHT